MKLALRLVVGVAALVLAALSFSSGPVEAQIPQCQVGNLQYNQQLCQQYTTGGTATYCNPNSPSYSAQVCQILGGTGTGTINDPTTQYCTPGLPTYNAVQCAGSTGTVNPACAAGRDTYNPTLCAQITASANPVCQVGSGSYSPTACSDFARNLPADVVVTINASGLNCAQAATVTAQAKTSEGQPVPNGTVIRLLATAGSVNPPQITLTNGVGTATYTAPASGQGSVTITGASVSAAGTAVVAVNCAPATPRPAVPPTAVPAAAAPAVAPPAVAPITTLPSLPSSLPAGFPSILPPNTGDGGLAQD